MELLVAIVATPGLLRIPQRDGPTIAVHAVGQSPRVLLVHGATASATCSTEVMQSMAARDVASAAIDLRGHAHSDGHEELQRFALEHYVQDVLAARGALPTIRTLVGHSMGGLVSQIAAAQVRLRRLVLVASSPAHGMLGDGARMRSIRSLYSSSRVTRSLLFHPEAADTLVSRFMDECQEESWLAATQMNTLRPDPTQVLRRVHGIAASHDNMVSGRSSLRTAAACRANLQVIHRSGHMIPLEAADELARAICDGA